MTTEELEKILGDTVEVVAPLVNGERFLRDLPFRAEGPYSTTYGGPLYAVATKKDILTAHARSRGTRRAFIERVAGL